MPDLSAPTQPYSPGVLSLLPLFYVGWSDSILSPSEIELIHRKLEEMEFLSASDRAYLIKWTNPLTPPDEATFKKWVGVLKAYAKKIDLEKKKTLIDLGIEIASVYDKSEKEQDWHSPKTRKALLELEEALGIAGKDSAKLLLSRLTPEQDTLAEDGKEKLQPAQFTRFLDGPYRDTIERIRTLLSDPIFTYQHIPDKDQHRLRVLEQLKMLAEQGLGAYSFPRKYGGAGKKGDHIAVFETLAYGDLSLTVKFGVQFGLFGGAVHMLGTEKHHRKYLEALHQGALLGCFAMTETGHGSNVKALETTATYLSETDEIIVHSPSYSSGKEYIGNAFHCSMAVVFAQLIVNKETHGVHAILVPMRDKNDNLLAGIKLTDCGYKMGLNGVDNGRIWFDQVRVPRENLLNRFGDINEKGAYTSPIKSSAKRFFTMLGALVLGRISVGLASVSVAKSALTIAVRYAMKRQQFAPKEGVPEIRIMDYPTHQHRLIPLVAKTYAYHFALRKLALKYTEAEKGDIRHIETLAAGLKAKASWHATQVVQESREACGGKGYLWENRLPDLKADSDIFTTFEGDNTVLLQLVAKGLLTKFKQSFHDEGYRAVVRYLYTRFSNRLQELNPVQGRNTSISHLLSSEFHLDAFEYRFQKLLFSLSSRMREYLKKRIDPHQAFLKCQLHMVALSHAYIDNIVLKSFYEAVDKCEDSALQFMLNKVCQLYALTVVLENKGWYLENEYLEGVKSKYIRRVHHRLVQELKPDVSVLVNGFGIPDQLLGAQIIK